LLKKYANQNPRGSGVKGRPPTGEQIVSLQFRLKEELERAEWAASEISKTQLGSDTSPREVRKKSKVKSTPVVTAGADTLGGGGEQRVPGLAKDQPLKTSKKREEMAKVDARPPQQLSPLRGTREERAAARAYLSEDKRSDTLFQNLTKREYKTVVDDEQQTVVTARRSSRLARC